MHRRYLAAALAALALVIVALAAPEAAQSKPARGQQSEAQSARSHQAVKRAKRTAKRVTRSAKPSRRAATKRVAASAKRSAKTVKPSVKRKAKRTDKRRSRQYRSRRNPTAVRHAARRVRVNKPVADSYVAAPPNPYQDDRFYYGPRAAPVRVVRKTKTVRAAAAMRDVDIGGGWSDVVGEARRWIGTNPTGRNSLWCARFMNFVLARAGYRGTGSDMARSFASYGRRLSGPRVGAIAVMSRGARGGHVGVVSGIDAKGNPIIISGNHNNRVAEAAYPRGRVRTYVMPGS
jgi:uncharacterized protein (TIGR02594 family)